MHPVAVKTDAVLVGVFGHQIIVQGFSRDIGQVPICCDPIQMLLILCAAFCLVVLFAAVATGHDDL